MSLFHVPESNPRLVDEQFAAAFPALGIVPTTNSGAYWGDGDGRPRAIDRGVLQFAHESKVRLTKAGKLYPTGPEMAKGLSQLRVRNPDAIRLFLVYHRVLDEFAISIPETDVRQLRGYGIEVFGTVKAYRGQMLVYRYFTEDEWYRLYDAIAAHTQHA